jgi:hypothetical protein
MLQQLISHSEDIGKLASEGYELEVNGAFLLVHHIPYVNPQKQIKYGTLVTVLTLPAPNQTGPPADHTMYFKGEIPCDALGKPLMAIINSSGNQQLNNEIQVQHYFSSKPNTGNYPDFYEKVRTYANILASQAQALDPMVTSRPGRLKNSDKSKEVFRYPDTNSARANIEGLNKKFHDQRIAIVGLGGTGSYILDLVAKTPVKEIHLFDGDIFQLHNAFRAPGAPAAEKFDENGKLLKTDYYDSVYSNMHNGIRPHGEFLSQENMNMMADIDFVFICVDKNSVRHFIAEHLLALDKPFIDVGLGIHLIEESLIGTIRVTAATSSHNAHLKDRIGKAEHELNEYAPNIQIADLNCLNAVFAVIKWKKMIGFYQDLKHEHNTLYFVNTSKLMNDDLKA